MSHGWARWLGCTLLAVSAAGAAQGPGQSQSSSSSKHTKNTSARSVPDIADGTVANGVYRNRALALTCKIPAGWVLRTEEMNARQDETGSEAKSSPRGTPLDQAQGRQGSTGE